MKAAHLLVMTSALGAALLSAGCGKPLYRAQPVFLPSPSAKPPAAPTADAGLQALVAVEAKQLPGRASVHVQVEGGPEAGVKADAPMPAASVIKLPIMAAMEDAWRTGRLKRTDADLTRVRKMITESNNAAADTLMGKVGMDRINRWLREHRYYGTVLKHRMLGRQPHGPNTVSARDMTRMLLEIAAGKLVSPEASAEMREILLDQKRRSRIPAGLPEGVPVGNKTGTLRGVVNDVAFVEPPGGKRYALAVLVDHAAPDETTSRAIAGLSRKVYAYLAQHSAAR